MLNWTTQNRQPKREQARLRYSSLCLFSHWLTVNDGLSENKMLQKKAIISVQITEKRIAIFAFFAIANIAMRFVSIHFILVPTFAPSTIPRVGSAAVIVSLDGRAREKRTARTITTTNSKTTNSMININALIEQGGSVKLGLTSEARGCVKTVTPFYKKAPTFSSQGFVMS